MPRRLAILFSGGGSTLQNLIDATRDGRLPDCEIVGAISSRKTVQGVERCEAAGVPCRVVSKFKTPGTSDHSRLVFDAVDALRPDLVCLAGWMSPLVLPEVYLGGRVVNVHPSLLPKHGGRGMFGRHVHAAVLAAGDAETGCTVHVVDNGIDTGPVLAQQRVPVLPGDTPETLAERVQAAERELYPRVIASHKVA